MAVAPLLASLRWDLAPPYPVPVDPTHPIVRGRRVRFYYPSGPELLTPVGGPSIRNSVAVDNLAPGRYGTRYFESASGPKYWQCSPGPILSGQPMWTVFVIARQTNTETSGGYWAYSERPAVGNDIITIGGRNIGAGGPSNNVVLTVRDDPGNLIQLPIAFSVVDGKHHSLCGVRYGATDHRIYFDGISSASSSTNVTNTYTNGSPANIGYDAQTGVVWNDEIKCVILFPGAALTQAEVIELTVNPWQILMPRTYPIWSAPGGGGGGGGGGEAYRWFLAA